MTQVSLERAQVNILFEIGGQVHIAVFEKEQFETVKMLAKISTESVAPTGKSQAELLQFLGYGINKEG